MTDFKAARSGVSSVKCAQAVDDFPLHLSSVQSQREGRVWHASYTLSRHRKFAANHAVNLAATGMKAGGCSRPGSQEGMGAKTVAADDGKFLCIYLIFCI